MDFCDRFVENTFDEELEAYNVNHNLLLSDMKTMMSDKTHSDFSFTVGGKQYCGHRVILAARSPVLDKMFKCDPRLDHMVIEHCECDVFEQILAWIYTGDTSGAKQLANPLLSWAKHFQLNALVTACEMYLKLENANAINVLIDAHINHNTVLLDRVNRYMESNARHIREQYPQQWTRLVQNYPKLVDNKLLRWLSSEELL